MRIVGIDPGQSGAICLYYNDQLVAHKLPYQLDKLDIITTYKLLTSLKPDRIITEIPFIPFGNKNKGLFNQLTNYGSLKAVCILLAEQNNKTVEEYLIEVPPATWKSKLKLSKDKLASIKLAKQIYPNILLKFPKQKVDNDNIAEALLLIYYDKLFVRINVQ